MSPTDPSVDALFTPIDPRSARLLDRAEHGMLTLSVFNSYFSQEIINFSVLAVHRRFHTFDVVTPGTELGILLEAAGYSPERAEAKVRKNLAMLRGRILKAYDLIGVPRLTAERHILTFGGMRGNPVYEELSAVISREIDRDAVFRDACCNISRRVLGRINQGSRPTREQLDAGVRYYIGEAAVMTDAAGMLGHDSSVTCYRHVIEFIKPLYEGRLRWRPAENQGYASLRPLP
ncbi:tRNA-dependent cyclodipeptide synthase [Streptomyces sp. SID8352]|uniref:tRNA-dependent cyclodipeptide synthase n=1 Tax=Streptomyces sp. SID8352 TaxID=2690338 RepID=UPI0013708874|nr:tRNA-dependent cyclodipeptide synthase [Streptomyces sp. SID8352]MYU21978.1 tRNA-dependent cyclodipeptide synthase [Streptomyces sp. SID8352]